MNAHLGPTPKALMLSLLCCAHYMQRSLVSISGGLGLDKMVDGLVSHETIQSRLLLVSAGLV